MVYTSLRSKDRGWTEESSRAQGTSKLYFPFPYLRLTSLWGMTVLSLSFPLEGPSLPRACGLQMNRLQTGWSCPGVVLPPWSGVAASDIPAPPLV